MKKICNKDLLSAIEEGVSNALSQVSFNKLYDISKFVSMTFDINSIPRHIRQKQYVDYQPFFDFVNQTSRLEILDEHLNVIDEEFFGDNTKSFSVKDAIDTLQSIYKISEYQFRICDPYSVTIVNITNIPDFISYPMSILVPHINKNLEIIDKEMKCAGYYKVAAKQYIDEDDQKWINVVYDPIVQESITKQLRDKKKYIYHCSPKSNENSINAKGFIPKNEGRVYKYCQPRIYFHCSDPTITEFIKMMKNISNSRKRYDPTYNGECVVYEIKVKDIPEHIEFYHDPHGLNSIYCLETVPFSCVKEMTEVTF